VVSVEVGGLGQFLSVGAAHTKKCGAEKIENLCVEVILKSVSPTAWALAILSP
jgi:hypothetical protein